jgi:hypothetical protein
MPSETANAFLDAAVNDLERLSGRAGMIGVTSTCSPTYLIWRLWRRAECRRITG